MFVMYMKQCFQNNDNNKNYRLFFFITNLLEGREYHVTVWAYLSSWRETIRRREREIAVQRSLALFAVSTLNGSFSSSI